jgi:hypothetical protein
MAVVQLVEMMICVDVIQNDDCPDPSRECTHTQRMKKGVDYYSAH